MNLAAGALGSSERVELRVRRRCPACRAPVQHSEADSLAVCRFCGLGIVVLRSKEPARYRIPPRVSADALAEASRPWLRERGCRVRELQAPYILYTPFFRMRTRVWQCWWDDAGNRGPLRAGPPMAGALHLRIGAWEQTIDGAPQLDLGDRHIGFRAQVLEVVPLEDGLGTEGDGESDAAASSPARLRIGIEIEEARRRLLGMLEVSRSALAPGVLEQRMLAPFPELQIVYSPYAVVPYRGPAERQAVVLDAVTGEPRVVLGAAAVDALDAALEARPGEAHAWRFERRSVLARPLVCPGCSAPLPVDPSAAVHVCGLCRRAYTIGERATEVPSEALLPARRRAGPRPAAHLPFYRVPGVPHPDALASEHPARRPRWLYIPAIHGRGASEIWRVALGLSRSTRERSTGPAPLPGARVDLAPEEVAALAGFAHACIGGPRAAAAPAPARCRPQLAWAPFGRLGPDLVELTTGLALRRSGVESTVSGREPPEGSSRPTNPGR